MKIKENILIIGMLWIGLIALSFWWNYSQAVDSLEKNALQSARSFFQQIAITRQWNAKHGGIYVPITEETQPNPYLKVPERDIYISPSLPLTKINPAIMARQLSEVAMEQKGIQFHSTSLKPIRPANKPSQREKAALEEFEQGTLEVGYFFTKDTESHYFYMAPLITKKACLGCHVQQGYKEGDIRGGTSITLPLAKTIPIMSLLFGHLTIALVGLVGIGMGGARLNRAYTTIRRQAVFDALTDIPNRRSFSESILREFKRSRRDQEPLSIILCDIDNFKAYNDTYGHTSGDICLKKVAQAIKKSLHRPADFCARYGGEEFVVILANTSLAGSMLVAERIRKSVVDLAITHKKSLPLNVVSLSLGVAISEDTSLISHEDLIRFADKALYQAKDKGKNRVEAFLEI